MNLDKRHNRVVITGMGVASPIGITCKDYKKALISGVNGVKEITRFDTSHLATRFGAETNLDAEYLKEVKDIKAKFLFWSTHEAYNMAFNTEYYKKNEGVICLGIGLDLLSVENLVILYNEGSFEKNEINNECRLTYSAESVTNELAKKYMCYYPPIITVSACAASSDAVGIGLNLIRTGTAKWAIVGGMDSMLNPIGFTAFSILGAMSKHNSINASRPFDKNRDGFIMGEGAGTIILENYDFALKRGATILGEIVGYGSSLDAYAISDPDPDGEGASQSMIRALIDSQINSEDIDYINAHGTSTIKNDIAETNAIKKVFKNKIPPVSSIKSMIGHCIASAGILELIAVFLTQQDNYLPPTINLECPGIGCDLDYIPNYSREKKCNYFLSNSFAFGGQNASLIGRIIR